uniref:Uncharacterized protein n=1 Tax=Kuenenia stuttgartiensis TaxID=174633 RepID=Q1Q6Y6_KUEST|nr:unknown protein [Candidatus Kuenenia stuttgartiensis]
MAKNSCNHVRLFRSAASTFWCHGCVPARLPLLQLTSFAVACILHILNYINSFRENPQPRKFCAKNSEKENRFIEIRVIGLILVDLSGKKIVQQ